MPGIVDDCNYYNNCTQNCTYYNNCTEGSYDCTTYDNCTSVVSTSSSGEPTCSFRSVWCNYDGLNCTYRYSCSDLSPPTQDNINDDRLIQEDSCNMTSGWCSYDGTCYYYWHCSLADETAAVGNATVYLPLTPMQSAVSTSLIEWFFNMIPSLLFAKWQNQFFLKWFKY